MFQGRARRQTRRRRRAGAALAAGVVLPAVAVGGCSSDSSDRTDTFVDRLATIPASVRDHETGDTVLQVVLTDLDRVDERAGLTRPEGTDQDEFVRYLQTIAAGFVDDGAEPRSAIAARLPEIWQVSLGREDEFRAELGWSFRDVTWFVEYRQGAETFVTLGGEFDEGLLTDALGERDGEVWKLGAEDRAINVEERSPVRRVGESLRFGLDDGVLFASRATAPVEEALAGDGPTLADDPVLGPMAAAFDEADAYSAILVTDASFEPRSSGAERPGPEAEMSVLPAPFTALGVGASHEDGIGTATFVYMHDDADLAAANAAAVHSIVDEGLSLRMGLPWSDIFTVASVDVDDTMVVARLSLLPDTNPHLAYDILGWQDGLAAYE